MRAILAWSFTVLLGAAVSSAWSQFPPPLPNGFQVDPAIAQVQAQMRASGMADAGGGTKANQEIPGCPTLIKISFSYGWTSAYLDKTTVDSMLKTLQDPTKDYG